MEGSLVAYKIFTNGSVLQASEVNENLMQQAVATFSNAAARTAAITSPVEGQMTYLEDAKQLFIYDGSTWQVLATSATNSYSLVGTDIFTSSGTFTKADYPWLRAIKVRVQGAGGGGGGVGGVANSGGAGGGGGGYAEVFITDIAGLSASITVTRGAGGAGGIGDANGSDGGSSSFGSLATGNGGSFGLSGGTSTASPAGGNGGSGTASGGIVFAGSGGAAGAKTIPQSGSGGSSHLGGGGRSAWRGGSGSSGGENGAAYGGGGAGARASTTATDTGGTGANGIVIVELYA